MSEDTIPYIDEVFKFRISLNAETDRGCALMGAAYLDSQLEQILAKCFVADEKVAEEVLGPSRPLGTFSSRIDLAYLLGLIGKQARRDLHLIRRIRNDFAHTSKPLTFDDHDVAQRCSEFYHDGLERPERPRKRFTRTVLGVLAVIHVKLYKMQPSPEAKDVVIDEGLRQAFTAMLNRVIGEEAADNGPM